MFLSLQRMLELARQRKENLDKMCADTSPLRKRYSNDAQQGHDEGQCIQIFCDLYLVTKILRFGRVKHDIVFSDMFSIR